MLKREHKNYKILQHKWMTTNGQLPLPYKPKKKKTHFCFSSHLQQLLVILEAPSVSPRRWLCLFVPLLALPLFLGNFFAVTCKSYSTPV